MAPRWSIMLAAWLVAAACGDAAEEPAQGQVATVPAPVTAPEERAALDELANTWEQHYNNGDTDAVAALYTEDAFWLTADGAYLEGRQAVAAWLRDGLAGAPGIDITTDDMMVFGDNAVARGRYSVRASAPDGSPIPLSGSWLQHMTRMNGNWRIAGAISNLDAEPPEGFEFFAGENRLPDDEGTMTELNEAWMQHYNAGDVHALAELYTEDAVVASVNSPFIEGRDAVRAALDEELGTFGGELVELHNVGTLELAEDWALDGGWFHWRGTVEGEPIETVGSFMGLMRRDAVGQWRIHWEVSNGRPIPEQ